MITVWVVLENEHPVTDVAVDRRSNFSCRWVPRRSMDFPEQALISLPNPKVHQIHNGAQILTSTDSRDFKALIEPSLSESVQIQGDVLSGFVFEDRYSWMMLAREDQMESNVFSGNVEEIRYIWDTSDGRDSSSSTVVTNSPRAEFPGRMMAAGKLVRVTVD